MIGLCGFADCCFEGTEFFLCRFDFLPMLVGVVANKPLYVFKTGFHGFMVLFETISVLFQSLRMFVSIVAHHLLEKYQAFVNTACMIVLCTLVDCLVKVTQLLLRV